MGVFAASVAVAAALSRVMPIRATHRRHPGRTAAAVADSRDSRDVPPIHAVPASVVHGMQTHPRGRHPAVFALAAAAVVGVLVLAGCSAAAPARPVASASARTRPPAAVTTSTSSAAGAPAPVSPAPATRGRGPAGPAGKWQTAQEVPGVGAMNTGGAASIVSVSCASAGNCSAVGKYGVNCGNDRCDQALVVSEVGGVWQQAEAVPGTATFNLGGDTGIDSVSCGVEGNCSAGG